MVDLFNRLFKWASFHPDEQSKTPTTESRDNVTYVFRIEIRIEDAHDNEKRYSNIDAWYNASCKRNYASLRFAAYAREAGLVLKASEDNKGDLIKLVWKCADLGRLGRYEQRTVFLIVADDNYPDLLFGREENLNILPDQPGQFDRGIEGGHLRRITPISFEAGIHRGLLRPVARSLPAEYGNVPMPILNEAQLNSQTEKEEAYNQESDRNIAKVYPSCSEPNGYYDEEYGFQASTSTLGTDLSWETPIFRRHSFKRNFLTYSDQECSSTSHDTEAEVRSSKRRISYDEPVPIPLNPHSNVTWSGSDGYSTFDSDLSCGCISTDLPSSIPSRNPSAQVWVTHDHFDFTAHEKLQFTSEPEGLVLTDRNESLGSSTSVDSVPTRCRTIKSNRNSTFSPCTSFSDMPSPWAHQNNSCAPLHATLDSKPRKRKGSKKRRKVMGKLTENSQLSQTMSPHEDDGAFERYWTLDEETGKYYHIDTETNKRWRYSPPPP